MEQVYDHKDTPRTKTTCTNGIEDTSMEVMYNELYNSTNQATNLYSVQVEYEGPTQTPQNTEPLNQSTLACEETHDLIKTKGPRQIGKIATWNFFLRKSDSLKPNSSQSPTKIGLKQGQPEDDGKT